MPASHSAYWPSALPVCGFWLKHDAVEFLLVAAAGHFAGDAEIWVDE